MPEILPGYGLEQRSGDGSALLAGFQQSQRLRTQQQQEQRLQQAALLDFYQTAASVQRQQEHDRQVALQNQAKGRQSQKDAEALAGWQAGIEIAKNNPKLAEKWQRANLASKVLKNMAARGVSPQVIERLIVHMRQGEADMEHRQAVEAGNQAIEGAVQDKILTPEQAQQFQQAPEKAVGAIGKMRDKLAIDQANIQKNGQLRDKAEQLVQTLEDGDQKNIAMAMIARYDMDSTAQKSPKGGADLLYNIQKVGVGKFSSPPAPGMNMSIQERNDLLTSDPSDLFTMQRARAAVGAGPGVSFEPKPGPEAHKTTKAFTSLVEKLKKEKKTQRGVLTALKESGRKMTPQLLESMKAALADLPAE